MEATPKTPRSERRPEAGKKKEEKMRKKRENEAGSEETDGSEALHEEIIDEEGWLHTGDIGVRLAYNGALRIIDRKANFIKM